jgi:hypothetical protein
LSNNRCITNELLDKFVEKWNWEAVIDSYFILFSEESAIEFYEKYKEFIPAAKLQESHLWEKIKKQRAQQILSEITT